MVPRMWDVPLKPISGYMPKIFKIYRYVMTLHENYEASSTGDARNNH